MTGKLKTKGNVMLATKLDGMLSVRSDFVPILVSFLMLFQQTTKTKGGKAKL
jgi:hypothetical protein